MRAVVQRSKEARVVVAGEVVGEISHGLVVFLAAGREDTPADLPKMVRKVVGLRVFTDDTGKMTQDVRQVGGGLLVVSQFTLYGDVRKGRRPNFEGAIAPGPAREQVDRFVELARAEGVEVATGRFGADMRVEVSNDGPVTILIDTAKTF